MLTWQRYSVRGPIALSAGVAVFTLAAFSPAFWDSALLAGWDVGVITWLLLTFFALSGAPIDNAPCGSSRRRLSPRRFTCSSS